jgi:hypothetical protein
MKPPRFVIGAIMLGIAAAGLLGGCASTSMARVKPWERAALSDPAMNPNRDPLGSAMSDHVYVSREASAGGRSVGGAGCGCN